MQTLARHPAPLANPVWDTSPAPCRAKRPRCHATIRHWRDFAVALALVSALASGLLALLTGAPLAIAGFQAAITFPLCLLFSLPLLAIVRAPAWRE